MEPCAISRWKIGADVKACSSSTALDAPSSAGSIHVAGAAALVSISFHPKLATSELGPWDSPP